VRFFRSPTHLAVALALLVLALAAVRDLTRLGDALPWRTMDEFADFYCAGSALDERASPYTYEPLRTCEHAVNAGPGFRGRLFQANPTVAVPAPQPAYDFLPFMALARLPAAAVRGVDAVAILAAIALCAVALAGLGVPLDLAVAALALSTAYVELNTAQIVPFSLLALTLCGYFLARGRDALAGVAASLTAIEPTAGIPVIAAALLFVPRARWAVVSTAAVLALALFSVLGATGVERYFTQVLPAHAASELLFPFQYSLTYALAFAGARADVARTAGSASYVVLAIAGLWIGSRIAPALERRELLVFIPALCAVIAGPFLHQEELCFALPALLVLAVASRGGARTALAAALCVLSIPWIAAWGMKQLLLASALVCAAILLRLSVARWAGIGIFCSIVAALYLLELRPPHLPVPAPAVHAYAADQIAEVEWRDYTAARTSRDPLWFLIKLPTWAALLVALTIAARSEPPPRGAFAPSRES
jgi:hypothetical protein